MPDPTELLATLRDRRRQLALEVESTDRELDGLLVDMWRQRTLTVPQIAATLGLSRQEVHRRIKRERALGDVSTRRASRRRFL